MFPIISASLLTVSINRKSFHTSASLCGIRFFPRICKVRFLFCMLARFRMVVNQTSKKTSNRHKVHPTLREANKCQGLTESILVYSTNIPRSLPTSHRVKEHTTRMSARFNFLCLLEYLFPLILVKDLTIFPIACHIMHGHVHDIALNPINVSQNLAPN